MSRKFFRNDRGINLGTGTSDPSDGIAGSFYYNTATSKIRIYNGTTWSDVGSGSGGGTNFIAVNDGSALTGWATYLDSDSVTFTDAGDLVTLNSHGLSNGQIISFPSITSTTGISVNTAYFVISATTNTFQVSLTSGGSAIALTTDGSGTMVRDRPVNGTGGSPSSTFATSTDSSLVGTSNYLWTKSANNRMGEGFSYDFSIDAAYKSKALTASFFYTIASGTFADDDMRVWIEDVTNGVLIQPSAYLVKNGSGAILQKCEFQASSNSTSYRLIVHTASVSASAYTLRFDSFSVAPNTYNTGAINTEPVAYTPIFTGYGTVSSVEIYSHREGAYLVVEGNFTAGTLASSTEARMSLGFGGVNGNVTTASIPTLRAVGNFFTAHSEATHGGATLAQASVGYINFSGNGVFSGNTLIALSAANSTATLFGNNDKMSLYAKVPIAGWGTSQALSSETATNVVSMIATGAPANATAGNVIIFPTISDDSNGAYNSSTGEYTIPVPGKYKVGTLLNAGWSAGNNLVYVYKNGSIDSELAFIASTNDVPSGCTEIKCIAGDKLTIRSSANFSSASSSCKFFVSRISGPAQIAASDTVGVVLSLSGNLAVTANTVVKFQTATGDTHGKYDASTGLYTVPTSGRYTMGGVGFASGGSGGLYIVKNGVNIAYLCPTNTANIGGGSYTVRALAGDTIGIYTDTSNTLLQLANSITATSVSINRTGNY